MIWVLLYLFFGLMTASIVFWLGANHEKFAMRKLGLPGRSDLVKEAGPIFFFFFSVWPLMLMFGLVRLFAFSFGVFAIWLFKKVDKKEKE